MSLAITFNGLFPIILTLGGIHGFLLSVLHFLRAKNKYSGAIIAIFLLSFALPTLNFAFINSSIGHWLPDRVVLEPFILLFGPSFYFFIKISYGDIDRKSIYVLHLIPFLTFSLLEVGVNAQFISWGLQYHLPRTISAIIYSVLVIYYYRNQTAKGRVIHKFGYIQVILLCYALYVLFTITFPILLLLKIENRLLFVYSFGTLLTILVYAIGFIAYWKVSSPSKRLKDELNKAEIKKIRNGLDVMIAEKFYLESSVRLQGLADAIETSPRYISRFINDELETSFPDFLNKLRVDEAKRLLSESTSNPKILAIALDAGFSNKATFNKHFKKHTGLTPIEFRNQQRGQES